MRKGARGVDYDKHGKKVLIWTSDGIGVISFEHEIPSDEIFEKGPKVSWIYPKSGNVEQAFWVYEGAYILFRSGTAVKLMEQETFGDPHLYEVAAVKEDTSVGYDEDSGRMYYLDAETSALTEMEIIPKHSIITLPFPAIEEPRRKAKAGAS
ncbi:MAG: hypothetical protein A2Z83_04460 [Omnitrophica bacterium GWA2_52_8]|nr:MAG: hypothetical protein A2Z83_04460 [Omnitrophica bacterium GWA2_52_8]